MRAAPYPLPHLGGATVLLVDDLVEDRALVASVLDVAGAGVFEVASADEAKASMPHLQPDVVITEMALPDSTGIDLVRWMRRREATGERATAVVALTRWAREYPYPVARTAGFDGYFTKPPATDDLVIGLAALLRMPRKPR